VAARLSLAALLATLALAAAGCGGDDESATEQWARDVCSAISTWTTSVRDATDSLTASSVGQNGLRDAVADVKAATSTLADDLKSLGPPDTDSGDQAKQTLDDLATTIQGNVDTIEKAADDASGASGALSAVSTISTTLSSMAAAVGSAFDDLQKLDAQGELEDAFRSASSCDDLTNGSS